MPRYLSIWLPFLAAERTIKLRPGLKSVPFVLSASERGRMLVKASGPEAISKGIFPGTVVADARAILPELQVFPYQQGMEEKLVNALALWCLRFTPVAAPDFPDGLLLDISGCAHLWGGEPAYLDTIVKRLKKGGYTARAAIADTIGAAWAVARYGRGERIVSPGRQAEAINSLPPAALRLDGLLSSRLQKLGFYTIGSFLSIPLPVLRRRFGKELLNRINQALGPSVELLNPVQPAVAFQKRLPCPDPVKTRTAINIALETLLKQLCEQLSTESKGLRTAIFKIYRTDNTWQQIAIGTNKPVRNVAHLMKLFEQKAGTLRPAWGIELFVLEAPVTEDLSGKQESLWNGEYCGAENTELERLLDRIAGRIGNERIRRYLPVERHWPEHSVRPADSLSEKPVTAWRSDQLRPICLLAKPERIKVTAPIPDYPPMFFIYQGKQHTVKKADGPERIEREWWLEQGQIRDYYMVEDEAGARYWLFRLGRYEEQKPEWFIHGFFS